MHEETFASHLGLYEFSFRRDGKTELSYDDDEFGLEVRLTTERDRRMGRQASSGEATMNVIPAGLATCWQQVEPIDGAAPPRLRSRFRASEWL